MEFFRNSHTHLYSSKVVLTITFSLVCLVSCKRKYHHPIQSNSVPTSIKDEEAMRLYNIYTSEDYDKLLSSMASSQQISASLKPEIINIFKQHRNYIVNSKKGITSSSIKRIEYGDSGKAANIFIESLYGDQTKEEIIFRLVYRDGKWYIR